MCERRGWTNHGFNWKHLEVFFFKSSALIFFHEWLKASSRHLFEIWLTAASLMALVNLLIYLFRSNTWPSWNLMLVLNTIRRFTQACTIISYTQAKWGHTVTKTTTKSLFNPRALLTFIIAKPTRQSWSLLVTSWLHTSRCQVAIQLSWSLRLSDKACHFRIYK